MRPKIAPLAGGIGRVHAFRAFLQATAAAGALLLAAAGDTCAGAGDKWQPFVDLEGRLGNEGSSGGGPTFYLPFYQDERNLTLFSLGGDLSPRHMIGSTGVIHRHLLPESGLFVGGNLFIDVDRSDEIDDANVFVQGGPGIEFGARAWRLRANGHIPFSGAVDADSGDEGQIQNGSVFLVNGEEHPLAGVDGGIDVCVTCLITPDDENVHELWFTAGGFYYDDSDVEEGVTGLNLAVEYQLHDLGDWLGPQSRLTAFLDADIVDDETEVYDSRVRGGLRVRIPLHAASKRSTVQRLTGIDRRMVDPVRRNAEVFSQVAATGEREQALDAITGVPLTKVVTIDAATVDPQAVIDAAGVNTLIVLDSRNGPIVDTTLTLGGNQTFAGDSFRIRGADSGDVAALGINEGRGRGIMTDLAGNENVIIAGNDVHVTGFDFTADQIALRGSLAGGLNNIGISNNAIAAGDAAMIFDDDLSNAVIERNRISSETDIGINSDGSDIVDSRIANNHFVDIAIDGFVANDLTNVTIVNNRFTDIGGAALNLQTLTTVTIANNSFENTGAEGLLVALDSANVRINGNRFADIGDTAIEFQGDIDGLAVDNNVFAGQIVNDVIEIQGGDIFNLSGAGNVNEAVVGGVVCDANSDDGSTIVINGIAECGP